MMLLLLAAGIIFMTAANGLMLSWIIDELAIEVPQMGSVITIYKVGVFAVLLGALCPSIEAMIWRINDYRRGDQA